MDWKFSQRVESQHFASGTYGHDKIDLMGKECDMKILYQHLRTSTWGLKLRLSKWTIKKPSKLVTKLLKVNGLEWPSQSPDLKPRERKQSCYVWARWPKNYLTYTKSFRQNGTDLPQTILRSLWKDSQNVSPKSYISEATLLFTKEICVNSHIWKKSFYKQSKKFCLTILAFWKLFKI